MNQSYSVDYVRSLERSIGAGEELAEAARAALAQLGDFEPGYQLVAAVRAWDAEMQTRAEQAWR